MAILDTRHFTQFELDKTAAALEDTSNPELAAIFRAGNTGINLDRKTWKKVDAAYKLYEQRQQERYESENGPVDIGFLQSVGMQVVIDDQPDNSFIVAIGHPPTPDLTEFIPQEVLDEENPDEELNQEAFPQCQCGCGGHTKGGRYIPGHDAKHKGYLLRKLFYGTFGDQKSTDAAAAEVELIMRGWRHFYPAFAKNEAKREKRRGMARCEICGRPLYDEESIEKGIGPVCEGRHN